MKKIRLSPFRLILISFILVILVGALLLFLPFSSKNGVSFFDCLFTSVSAVCVTGLVVLDTATTWTLFGKIIILLLIQIGGLGVVTVAASLVLLAGGKIGIYQRSLIEESTSANTMGGMVKLLKFILAFSFSVEALGAILLMPTFIKAFGIKEGIFCSFFHSISAFCNAGFDLMGDKTGTFSSLTSFSNNTFLIAVISILIIIGGLGFLTWKDIKENKLHFKKYSLQSKIIISVSLFLIFVPFVFFLFSERELWRGMTIKERILSSFFQSVTTRTAGFNSVDFASFSDSGKLVSIILMLIGGSPGSTAGGLKTTTVAIFVLSALSSFKRRSDVSVYSRKINNKAVKNASALVFLYLTLFLLGGIIINMTDGCDMLSSLFESASALATVGLSLGLTTKLGVISRTYLMILMYIGRVGGLTLLYGALTDTMNEKKYPEEKVNIG